MVGDGYSVFHLQERRPRAFAALRHRRPFLFAPHLGSVVGVFVCVRVVEVLEKWEMAVKTQTNKTRADACLHRYSVCASGRVMHVHVQHTVVKCPSMGSTETSSPFHQSGNRVATGGNTCRSRTISAPFTSVALVTRSSWMQTRMMYRTDRQRRVKNELSEVSGYLTTLDNTDRSITATVSSCSSYLITLVAHSSLMPNQ